MKRGLQRDTLVYIQKVYDWLEANGPVQADNCWEIAHAIGIDAYHWTRVVQIVRQPWWIETNGWTIPFVPKGIGLKTYSVEHTHGKTALLRTGNRIKADEMETHMRNNLAGLQLEAKLATGSDKRKATILSIATKSAIDLIDAIKP